MRGSISSARSTAGSPSCTKPCGPSSTPASPGSCSSRPHAVARNRREGKCGLRAGPGLADAAGGDGPRRASQRALPAGLWPGAGRVFCLVPVKRLRRRLCAGSQRPRSTSRSPPCASSPQKPAVHGGLSPLAAAGIRGGPGSCRSGVRTGNWLTLQQAQQLLFAPNPETIKGLRIRVLLGSLVGYGLRRRELAGLEFANVAQREGRWAIVDLLCKHGRVRTVPMPSWAKSALDGWASTTGISTGVALRRVDKAGRVGEGPIQARTPRPRAARADPDLARPCLDPDYRALPGAPAKPARCAL